MEDKFNTGETRYKDANGKDLTEQEYKKKQGSGVGGRGSAKTLAPGTRNLEPELTTERSVNHDN